MLTFLFEIDRNFRRVFTDGRAHAKDLDLTWYGESIGTYEGDSLTVDTVSLSDRSWLDTAGHQHSDKLHITEKITKTAADSFVWTVTYDDPVYFTKPRPKKTGTTSPLSPPRRWRSKRADYPSHQARCS